jgi:hypothetical protein
MMAFISIYITTKKHTELLPPHFVLFVRTYATLRTCFSFPFRSGAHCFFTIIREEGVRGLYHGLSVNLVRGVGGAILLVGYDEAKALLKGSETLM